MTSSLLSVAYLVLYYFIQSLAHFHLISGSFSDPVYYSFVFHSSQVQLKGGDQETQLFCLQSLQLVPCFLLSTGFQNRYINDILMHKIINDGASLLGNFAYVISWNQLSSLFQ